MDGQRLFAARSGISDGLVGSPRSIPEVMAASWAICNPAEFRLHACPRLSPGGFILPCRPALADRPPSVAARDQVRLLSVIASRTAIACA